MASVTTLPFLEIAASNRTMPLPRLVLVWWGVAVLVTAAPVIAVHRAAGPRTARRLATVLVPLLWLFFHAHHVASTLEGLGLHAGDGPAAWVVVAGSVAIAMVVLSRHAVIRVYLAILAPLALVAPTALALTAPPPDLQRTAATPAAASDFADRPNVHVFLVDGYPDADVVLDRSGVDITDFQASLEDRGFVVSDDAMANYPATFASVPSLLTMDYPFVAGDQMPRLDHFFRQIQGDNPVVSTFRDQGYAYVHAYTWAKTACRGLEELCIGDGGTLDQATWAIVRQTPLATFVQRSIRPLENLRHYSDPATVVAELDESGLEGPTFTFAHLLNPHPPFARTADCSPRQAPWNISDWLSEEAFGGAVTCLNDRLVTAVDAVLADDPDAVIVIQGDHGSAFGLDWVQRRAEDVRQRMPIFSAIRLPAECRPDIPDAITPVNTFRVIFACLRGETPVLLDDRFYWVHYRSQRVWSIDDLMAELDLWPAGPSTPGHAADELETAPGGAP